MKRSITAVALAAALLTGWTVPAGAQQNGIVIQNNGVDSADSAAGADNVRISRAPGSSQSVDGAGLNNEIGTAPERKERNRKNRDKNSGDEAAAPVEAAPAEGDYQAYADPGYVPEETWVDPASAPQEVAQEGTSETTVVRLPSTGIGIQTGIPWSALWTGLAAVAGLSALRRRAAA